MEQNYWQLGHWKRIPVAMHWTVLISFAWLYIFFWDLLATLWASIALSVLFVCHEFGHVLLLKRRKIVVEGIEFFGIHGKTQHAWASTRDEMFVAWGGVLAQMLVLLAALVLSYLLGAWEGFPLWSVAAPMLFVFTKLNIFLMIVALLPIGPFDGNAAWKLFPWLRRSWRQRRRAAREAAFYPEKNLTPERYQELDERSAKAAADVLEKLGKQTRGQGEDAS